MYHSIYIGNKNTWDDWHLVPASRPVVNPPEFKSKTVDIPGANGMLDFSTSLTGYPTYANRTGSWEFIVMNGYDTWINMYSKILNHLHGQSMKVVMEDEPEFYYEGRITVNEWRSEANWSRIVLDYSLWPYKRRIWNSVGTDATYDPFTVTPTTQEFYDSLPFRSKTIITSSSFQTLVNCDTDMIGTEPVTLAIQFDSAMSSGMDVTVDLRFIDSITGDIFEDTVNAPTSGESTIIDTSLRFIGHPGVLSGKNSGYGPLQFEIPVGFIFREGRL